MRDELQINSGSTKKKNTNKILFFIFYFSVILFFIAFNFKDTLTPFGWYQQNMPNPWGAAAVDMIFTDSLNGYAVTQITSGASYILKTTNGGDNWSIIFTNNQTFRKIKFINANTGFATTFPNLLKTTNAGENWNTIILPETTTEDIYVLNEDTIWIVGCNGFYDNLLRTTNGGISWQMQFGWGSLQETHIYMYNSRIGFATLSGPAGLWKTTNSGENWINIANEYFTQMYFLDSLNGWKTDRLTLKKTTNGGYNWIAQTMPSGGYIFRNTVKSFAFINKDTLWGVGGYLQYPYPPLVLRGMIYRTTNSGLNWGYQLPDTHLVQCGVYGMINFINKNVGWAYNGYTGVHTLMGGDTVTIFTGIQKISNKIPNDFILNQNYPNPFNPRTVIGYELIKNCFVLLDVFDISGKEVCKLVNERQNSGVYEVDFPGKYSPSGIYFYRLIVDGKIIGIKKMVLIK